MENADELNTYLDHQMAGIEVDPSPSPDPSASPDPLASPVPSPTPLAVQDTDLIALVAQASQEQTNTRIAQTGSFYVLCLMLTILIAAVLLSVLRRR